MYAIENPGQPTGTSIRSGPPALAELANRLLRCASPTLVLFVGRRGWNRVSTLAGPGILFLGASLDMALHRVSCEVWFTRPTPLLSILTGLESQTFLVAHAEVCSRKVMSHLPSNVAVLLSGTAVNHRQGFSGAGCQPGCSHKTVVPPLIAARRWSDVRKSSTRSWHAAMDSTTYLLADKSTLSTQGPMMPTSPPRRSTERQEEPPVQTIYMNL